LSLQPTGQVNGSLHVMWEQPLNSSSAFSTTRPTVCLGIVNISPVLYLVSVILLSFTLLSECSVPSDFVSGHESAV